VFERDDGELCAVFQKEAPEHVLNALLINNAP
jgi:hypothetical protein